MEESKLLLELNDSSSERYQICMGVCLSFIELLIVVSIGATISIYDDDCYRPIRLWMIILMATFSLHVLSLIIFEVVLKSCIVSTCINRLYNFINSLVHSFVFVWMLTGSVWMLDDSKSCAEGMFYLDFYVGFIVVMVTLLVYYTILASVFLLVFCATLIACYGRMKICKAIEEYSEV